MCCLIWSLILDNVSCFVDNVSLGAVGSSSLGFSPMVRWLHVLLQSNKPECEQLLLLLNFCRSCHFLGGFGSLEKGKGRYPETSIFALRMNPWKIIFPIGYCQFQSDMLVSANVPIDTIVWFGPWFLGKLFGGPCHWLFFFLLPVCRDQNKKSHSPLVFWWYLLRSTKDYGAGGQPTQPNPTHFIWLNVNTRTVPSSWRSG